jgi:branched-chain amino acid transport system substrate-binding protein
MSFYRQWAAAGMLKKIPIVSVVFGGGQEHEILNPDESDGVIAAFNYFQELDTPDNHAFLKRFEASAGTDHPYINGIAIGGYNGPMIWAEAVKKAGSFERDAVMAALIGNIEWTGPGGRMVTDGKTHSTQQDVHIIQVKDRKWSLIETKSQIPPYDFGGRCDLIKNPKNVDILNPQV